jgi:FHS family L-fucose permease-like MFS transporter
VAAFQTVMELSTFEASWVQFAFYGGYATMAIPAALFIRRYNYKSGILLGLGLYAIGAFLFIPAAMMQNFLFFCLSLYILTFGLAFLETTANPFILSLGSKESATRRLYLSQAFNPLGSLLGMAVASTIVLPSLLSDQRNGAGETFFHTLSEAEKANIRLHDLAVIRDPYVILGIVVLIIFLIIAFKKMPQTDASVQQDKAINTVKRLWQNKVYREGVVTQVFYVAAQIMVWTYIIHYADNLGINKATAQNFNIIAMCLFLCGRFICTFLMRFINTRLLLGIFGIGAMLCTFGTIAIVGKLGLYCLVGISVFMSLMFPTIYGIALENVESQDTSLGAAFLVMAIVGGAIMPPLQGLIIDKQEILHHPAVNISFILPLLSFAIITLYGFRTYRKVAA